MGAFARPMYPIYDLGWKNRRDHARSRGASEGSLVSIAFPRGALLDRDRVISKYRRRLSDLRC